MKCIVCLNEEQTQHKFRCEVCWKGTSNTGSWIPAPIPYCELFEDAEDNDNDDVIRFGSLYP